MRPPGPENAGDPLIGQTVANYRLVRRIGQGGMGAVYLAHHTVLQRSAAIKVLLPEFSNNRELVGRFLNEARATAQLRHRGFVEIFDSGILGNGSAYLAMEYLRGASLATAIEWRKTLSPSECMVVLLNVAQSVAHAHKHGIVHRDLKPDNIFLSVAGDGEDLAGRERVTVKVLDFGIAKLTAASNMAGGSARTRTGSLLGTPLYMSPEQCRGAGQVDHRTDIYSLGCIAYHALTGLPPFPLEGFGEIISAHLNQVPASMRSQVASLPEALDTFVLRLLEKNPAARPQTMDAVTVALQALRFGQPGATSNDLTAAIPPASLTPALASTGSGARIATVPMPDDDPLAMAGSPTPRPWVKSGETRRVPTDLGPRAPGTFSTLAGAAAEVGGSRPASRVGRAAGIIIGLAAGVAVAVGLVLAFGTGGRTPSPRRPEIPRQTPTAEIEEWRRAAADERPRARPSGSVPAPETVRPAETGATSGGMIDDPVRGKGADAGPTVTVRLASVPTGAAIVDRATGRVTGVTPFEGALPRSQGERVVILKKRGYRPKQVTIDLSRNTDVTLTLDRHGPAVVGAPDDSEEDRRKL